MPSEKILAVFVMRLSKPAVRFVEPGTVGILRTGVSKEGRRPQERSGGAMNVENGSPFDRLRANGEQLGR
jgi:hypothetical protein